MDNCVPVVDAIGIFILAGALVVIVGLVLHYWAVKYRVDAKVKIAKEKTEQAKFNASEVKAKVELTKLELSRSNPQTPPQPS